PLARGLHRAARRPHRAAGAGAGRARGAAGGGYFRRERAGCGWLRPHRRALTRGSIDVKLSNKTRQAVVQSRRALQLLAALLVLLAAWLAWTGWQQMQDGTRRNQLATTRDALAQSTGRALQSELARLEER